MGFYRIAENLHKEIPLFRVLWDLGLHLKNMKKIDPY